MFVPKSLVNIAIALFGMWPMAANALDLPVQEADVSRIYQELLPAFAEDWRVTPRLLIEDEGNLASLHDGTIQLGLSHLTNAAANAAPDSREIMLQFIILHEVWHQVQYREYDLESSSINIEMRRLFECQADLMAILKLGSVYVSKPDALKDLPSMIYDIGDMTDSYASHPSNAQRRVTALLGLYRATYDNSDKLFATNAAAYTRQLSSFADVRSDEPKTLWSYRQCALITHFNEAAVAAVSMSPNPRVYWAVAPDANSGNVSFSTRYLNRGDRAVRVTLEMTVAAFPVTDIANHREEQRLNGRRFEFDMQPGGEHILTDVLAWGTDPLMVPKLIYPPAAVGSLITAEFLGPSTPVQSPSTQPAPKLNRKAAELYEALLAYSNNSTTDFKSLQGELAREDAEQKVFLSKMPIPGATRTLIHYHRNGRIRIRGRFDGNVVGKYGLLELSDKQAVGYYNKYRKLVVDIYPQKPLLEDSHDMDIGNNVLASVLRLQITSNLLLELTLYREKNQATSMFDFEIERLRY